VYNNLKYKKKVSNVNEYSGSGMTAYRFFSTGTCIIHHTGWVFLEIKQGIENKGVICRKLTSLFTCANHLKAVQAEVQWMPNSSYTSNANSVMS